LQLKLETGLRYRKRGEWEASRTKVEAITDLVAKPAELMLQETPHSLTNRIAASPGIFNEL